jgi:hypothetical protein
LKKDKKPNDDESTIFKDTNEPCPVINIPVNEELRNDNPTIIPIVSIIAAIVVASLAVIVGIAFALRAKQESGLLESEAFLSGNSTGAIKSPLYEPETTMSSNKLYEGGKQE